MKQQRFIALLHLGEFQTDGSGAIMGVLEGGYSIEYLPLDKLQTTSAKDIFVVEEK